MMVRGRRSKNSESISDGFGEFNTSASRIIGDYELRFGSLDVFEGTAEVRVIRHRDTIGAFGIFQYRLIWSRHKRAQRDHDAVVLNGIFVALRIDSYVPARHHCGLGVG